MLTDDRTISHEENILWRCRSKCLYVSTFHSKKKDIQKCIHVCIHNIIMFLFFVLFIVLRGERLFLPTMEHKIYQTFYCLNGQNKCFRKCPDSWVKNNFKLWSDLLSWGFVTPVTNLLFWKSDIQLNNLYAREFRNFMEDVLFFAIGSTIVVYPTV